MHPPTPSRPAGLVCPGRRTWRFRRPGRRTVGPFQRGLQGPYPQVSVDNPVDDVEHAAAGWRSLLARLWTQGLVLSAIQLLTCGFVRSQPVEKRILVGWCSPFRHLGPPCSFIDKALRRLGYPQKRRVLHRFWGHLTSPRGIGREGPATRRCGRALPTAGPAPRPAPGPGPGDPPPRRTRLPRP